VNKCPNIIRTVFGHSPDAVRTMFPLKLKEKQNKNEKEKEKEKYK
jgi:hypothetical protein